MQGVFHIRFVLIFDGQLILTFFVHSRYSDNYGMSVPVTPKKNARAFGSSGAVASSEWYDSKLPNCVDFDKPSMYMYLSYNDDD